MPLFAVVCRDGVGPPAKWATEPIPRKHRRNERSSARFSFAVVCLSMSARGGRWVHLSTKRDQVALVPHAHGRSGGRRSIQLSYWRGDNLHPPPPSSTTSYQIGASGFEPATSWSRSGTKSPRVATQYSNHAVFWASVSRHGSAKQPGIARNSRRGFVNQTPPRPPECTWGKNHRGRPDESPLLGRFVLATRSVPARVPLGADERAVAEGVRAQRVDERRRRIDGRVLDVVHCAPARRVQPGLVAHTLRALVVGARRVATEAEATDDVPAGTVSGTPPPNVMMPPATSPVPPPWPLGGAKKSGLKGFELFSPYEGMARLDERVQPSSGQR